MPPVATANAVPDAVKNETPTPYLSTMPASNFSWQITLVEKVVAITGANRGIGLGIAEVCLANSAKVVYSLDMMEPGEDSEGLQKRYPNFRYIQTDVTSEESVQKAIDQVVQETGRIDGLVANAGMTKHQPALNFDRPELEKLFNLNVFGAYFCAQIVARKFIELGIKGSIVMTSSMTSYRPNRAAPSAPYGATKAAVRNMCHTLAMEWSKHGIRVNSISPGFVRTAMTYYVEKSPDWDLKMQYYGGMPRLADPRELGGAYVYLLSDGSSYTTGIDIPIAGIVGAWHSAGLSDSADTAASGTNSRILSRPVSSSLLLFFKTNMPKSNEVPATTSGRISKHNAGWRRVVRHFSPSWFSTTMGTGIVAVLMQSVPFHTPVLHYLSIVFFLLNVVLFGLAFLTSVLRYSLYPEIWRVMIQDPTNSLYMATAPMGFATLIEMWIFICVPLWGPWAITVAWVLWIIDVVAAAAVTLSLSFILISQRHITSLDRITAIQLLPIAATIVAAGVGARVAGILPNESHALGTLLVSYILWGMGTPLALVVLVIYYQRLAVHKLPPREMIVSCFLPLGPLGFGGFGIIFMGKVARELLANSNILDPLAGRLAYVLGAFISLLMWSFGLIWLVFALATVLHSSPFPFNMGWWGFTFPLGVYAANTMELGIEMDLMFFKVLGTIALLDIEHGRSLAVGIGAVANRARGMAWESLLCSMPAEPDIER
ncbi:hypothetical protein N7474_003668 [Penicillium riverlandense]|uniref:uncharacterized protein n=1 Tax=Penicillium riverlandense TaxID=1903569 RepID=UPI002547F480|nr:uncharacterized protein N7474_003668 [Penicillium riverlandense]KAJ5818077.1 hypothetical protein N7474_003668 [Penicillium riverlandense]